MKKIHLLSIIIMILIYGFSAYLFNNEMILPSLYRIVIAFKDIMVDINTIYIVIESLYRFFMALLLSFLIAFALASIAYFDNKLEDFFKPFMVFIKTVPNVSIMIFCLILFNIDIVIIIIGFLVMMPILYEGILASYKQIDNNLILYTNTLEPAFIIKFKRVYLPLIKCGIKTSLLQTSLLGFKVCIMAELLALVKTGIGKELYLAKIFLYSDRLIAWTIIIILISFIFEIIIKGLFNIKS